MPKGFFYIECKLKLRCLTILWKSRWVGGGGLWTLKSWGEGGSKNRAFRREGVDFLWNNPFWLGASRQSFYALRGNSLFCNPFKLPARVIFQNDRGKLSKYLHSTLTFLGTHGLNTVPILYWYSSTRPREPSVNILLHVSVHTWLL